VNAILRLTVCLAALGVAGLGLDLVAPGGLPNLAAELASLPRLKLSMRTELDRQQQLDEENVKILARITAKRQIAFETVAGRVTFLEAANRFRELAEADSRTDTDQSERLPRCPEEKYFRAVIAYARAEFSAQPDVLAVLLPRLEQELRQALDEACLRKIAY
jgi:hypothetical protein